MLPLVLLFLPLAFPAFGQQAVFPSIQADNLNGETISLPGGLAGSRNLILIAFQREQQKDLDTWLKALPAIAAAAPEFDYYECPTIQKPNRMVRFFIDNGMRSGIPDKAQRARTVTLYLEKAPFKEALGIDSEKTVYALLIDKAGNILWREDGLFSEAKGKSLQQALSR
jgi:hypothetical protein